MPDSRFRFFAFAQGIPGYTKLIEWAKLTGITGGTQFLIQAIGLLSGILVVRLLPTEEYALYTLANTMLGVMTILADGGIGSGVMAQGGRVWKVRDKLGGVLNTALELRKKFLVGSFLVGAPILIYQLHHHGASNWTTVLIVLSLVPALVGALTGSVFAVPMKLHQDITPLQKNLIKENFGRLMMIFTLFIFPWTFIAILASGIPRMYLNISLKKKSKGYVDWSAKEDPVVRRDILKIVKRILPGAIYFCVSGQISIWLISFFGDTASVAQIGALGRIAVMLTVVNTLFGTLVYPRFARMPGNDRSKILKRFFQIIGLMLIICSLIIAGVWMFSDQILWILGNQYANLNYALLLSIIGSCTGMVSGAVFKMTTHRNWAIHPAVSIPISIASIIVGALLMDVSTLEGVLKFNIFVVFTQVVLNLGYFLFEISRFKSQHLKSE